MTAAAALADDVITLRVWGGVPAEAGPQASIDLFNEAFKDKGIQAEYERFVNDDTGNLKLETSLLAGNDVDLYMTYTPAVLQKRASGNMALDLTELVERDGFDIEGIFGKMALAYYIDGKPYSLPTKMDQYGIVINKDMFDAAGIEVPTEWSFEEFREIARKLTHGEGDSKVYGMFFNSRQDLLYPFNYFSVQTLGGDPLYHADGTANVNDPVNVAAIELVNNMMNVDHTAPTHTDSVTQKLSHRPVDGAQHQGSRQLSARLQDGLRALSDDRRRAHLHPGWLRRSPVHQPQVQAHRRCVGVHEVVRDRGYAAADLRRTRSLRKHL